MLDQVTDPQNIENELIDCDIFLNDGIIQSSGASTVIKIENEEIKIYEVVTYRKMIWFENFESTNYVS